jgi:hypothetical protein
VAQAFALSCPAGMVDKTYLYIEFESLFKHHPQSPIVPRSFEFKSIEGRVDDWPRRTEQEPVARYHYVVNGIVNSWSEVRLNDLHQNEVLSSLHPQWPWIFAQCAAMGDIAPRIAHIRLVIIIMIVRTVKPA